MKTLKITHFNYLFCFLFTSGLQTVYAQTTIPPSYAAPDGTVNTNQPGFVARPYQIPVPLTPQPGDSSSLDAAERVLAGQFLNTGTGQPYANLATPGPNSDGTYNVTNVINFNQDAGSSDIGFFGSDEPIPGIPGTGLSHFAIEFTGFLDLPAGTNRFGATYKTDVNNDDGYRFTIGIGDNPKDAFAVQAGTYDPSKGTASSEVAIAVTSAGIYPVRLIWWVGVRHADFEFYSIDSSNTKILVNDATNAGAIKAYRSATPTTAPYARQLRPFPNATGVSAIPTISVELVDQTTEVNTNTIVLRLNGASVAASITKTGAVTTVSFTPTALLGQGSTNAASIGFSDSGATTLSNFWSFVVQDTFVLPIVYASPGTVNSNAPGFTYRVVQGSRALGNFPNTPYRGEAQLAGTWLNPDTGLAYTNEALPGPNPDGSYNFTNEINLNGVANQSAHNFPNDILFPGIPGNADPGLGSVIDNFTIECLTFLQLSAGSYTMAVNGDDGVVVYALHDLRDIFGNPLVAFNGGEADRSFGIIIQTNGYYPFRFVFWNGAGNVNCEWFSITNDLSVGVGGKVLINDATNVHAIKAWREMSVTRPYISAAVPGPGAADVYRTDGKLGSNPLKVGVPVNTSISFTGTDGTLTLLTNTIVLKLDNVTVTPTINKTGGTTTISYTPGANLAEATVYTVALTYSDSGGNVRNLTTKFLTEKLPTGWTAVLPDGNGLGVWEAETFDLNSHYPGGDPNAQASGGIVPYYGWEYDNSILLGYSGAGYVIGTPNIGETKDPSTAPGGWPRLDYNVYFAAAGTNYVWIRGQGNNGSDDSLWISIDGDTTTTAAGNAKRNNGALQGTDWIWTGNYDSPGSGRMHVYVPSEGTHTINLFLRESGLKIDKLLVTTDVNFAPVGTGPAVSPRLAPALGIIRQGSDIQLSWPTNFADGFILQSESSLAANNWVTVSTIPTLVGSQYMVTVTNATGTQYYRLKK
jgi:hypothetical protein